jgi:hypothetical protein
VINVQVPTRLSAEQKRLMRDLGQSLGHPSLPKATVRRDIWVMMRPSAPPGAGWGDSLLDEELAGRWRTLARFAPGGVPSRRYRPRRAPARGWPAPRSGVPAGRRACRGSIRAGRSAAPEPDPPLARTDRDCREPGLVGSWKRHCRPLRRPAR